MRPQFLAYPKGTTLVFGALVLVCVSGLIGWLLWTVAREYLYMLAILWVIGVLGIGLNYLVVLAWAKSSDD